MVRGHLDSALLSFPTTHSSFFKPPDHLPRRADVLPTVNQALSLGQMCLHGHSRVRGASTSCSSRTSKNISMIRGWPEMVIFMFFFDLRVVAIAAFILQDIYSRCMCEVYIFHDKPFIPFVRLESSAVDDPVPNSYYL